MTDRTELGKALEQGLREVLAWKRGELALETVNIDHMPAERVRASTNKNVGRSGS